MTPVDVKNEILEGVRKKLGFVPNIYKEMVKSPAALEVYVRGNEALDKGALTLPERQAVMLTVSVGNKCAYCSAAHAMLAKKTGVSPADVDAIRSGGEPRDARLKALVSAARLAFEKRGWLDAGELKALEAGGVDRAQLYEVVAIIGVKTVSNYINHINHTALDPELGG